MGFGSINYLKSTGEYLDGVEGFNKESHKIDLQKLISICNSVRDILEDFKIQYIFIAPSNLIFKEFEELTKVHLTFLLEDISVMGDIRELMESFIADEYPDLSGKVVYIPYKYSEGTTFKADGICISSSKDNSITESLTDDEFEFFWRIDNKLGRYIYLSNEYTERTEKVFYVLAPTREMPAISQDIKLIAEILKVNVSELGKDKRADYNFLILPEAVEDTIQLPYQAFKPYQRTLEKFSEESES